MNDDLIRQRIRDLEDNLRQDLKLLKDFEDAIRLEDDPRRKARYRQDIERQRESLDRNQNEYDDLESQIAAADRLKISDLLLQKDTKLANLQKLLPPIWNVPFSQNPNFTGREQTLAELYSVLLSNQPGAWKEALWGMGGVGKTQIAVEYAYRHKAEYEIVWWLRSEEPTTLSSDYAAMATDLDLAEKGLKEQSEIVKAVRRWLEHNSGWLLIFDNAQNPKSLNDFLPRGGGGHVIMTSRNPEWGSDAKVLEIKVFSRQESIDFLLDRTKLKDDAAAGALAEVLGDLPLALEQAAAYISKGGMPFSRYLEMFKKHRKKILERGEPTAYLATVATTWEISLQRVLEDSPAGADLLKLFSFLAPDEIPKSLLIGGAEHLPETLASAIEDELELEDAISALRGYSLMSMAEGLDSFSIHRLVQAVTLDRLSEDDRKEWAESAIRLVNDAFPFDVNNLETWEESRRLLPHALAAAGNAESEYLEIASEETAGLLNQAAGYLQMKGEFLEAKNNLEQALKIDEAVYGPDHPNVATIANNRGSVLQDLGELDEARKCFERALKIDEAVYGPDHLAVAIDVNNLGSVLKDLGELDEARKCFERALKIDEAVYGPDHPNVARDVNNLGLVLKDLGELDEARKYFERVLGILRKFLGDEHPLIQTVKENLDSLDAREQTK